MPKVRKQRKRASRKSAALSTPSVPAQPMAAPRGAGRFLLLALVLMALLYSVYYYPHAPDSVIGRFFVWYVEQQARLAGGLCAMFDGDAQITGTVISGPIPLRVVKDCSSLDVQALFAATVLAFPARWPSKLLGLVIGIPLLGALNLLRIAGLHFVGMFAPRMFDTAHEELFPALLLLAAVTLFALWVRKAQPLQREPHAVGA
jgi:exosortase H (IPTLxxWG-CTERM-specific)